MSIDYEEFIHTTPGRIMEIEIMVTDGTECQID